MLKILFLSPSLPLLDDSFLEYIQKRNIPYALLFVDLMQCMGNKWIDQISPKLKYFYGKTYSCDETDASNYNWIFTLNYYSKQNIPEKELKTDVFLALYDKGRASKALHYYDILSRLGIKCLFYITGVSDEFSKLNSRPGIIYNEVLRYSEVIGFVKESRVILELCQKGQTSNTLRAFEAVVYDKKLITDNPDIVHFPFFNETTMKYIPSTETLEQLPLEFFRKQAQSYNYDGSFSPTKLFDLI